MALFISGASNFFYVAGQKLNKNELAGRTKYLSQESKVISKKKEKVFKSASLDFSVYSGQNVRRLVITVLN